MEPITIRRSKLYQTPGKNYRYAWQWLYRVAVPGEPREFVGQGLEWARKLAKRKRREGQEIVEAWRYSQV